MKIIFIIAVGEHGVGKGGKMYIFRYKINLFSIFSKKIKEIY